MVDEPQSVTIAAELAYRDPEGALAWLTKAFGFETRLVVSGADGKLIYAASGTGGTVAAILPESPPVLASPKTSGASSCTVHLRYAPGTMDIDEHFARAKAAGAEVLIEPRQEFYGDLEYLCRDPEGHIWNVGVRGDAPPGPPPEGITVRFPNGRPR